MNSARDPLLRDMISSSKNTWVQSIVALHRSRDRYGQQRFLVEGSHAVQEACRANWPVEVIVVSEGWVVRNPATPDWIPANVRIQIVSDGIAKKIATTENPEGILAICPFHSPEKNPSLAWELVRHPPVDLQLAVVAERLQDPGNLGTLVRSAVACDANGVFLTEGSVDPFHPKVLRSTAGQWFQTPPRTISWRPWLEECRSKRVRVLAAAAGGKDFWNFDFRQPTVFLLGNEGAGLSEELSTFADDVVSIPMSHQVESLNVAMTGTLLLYEAKRQRRAASK